MKSNRLWSRFVYLEYLLWDMIRDRVASDWEWIVCMIGPHRRALLIGALVFWLVMAVIRAL